METCSTTPHSVPSDTELQTALVQACLSQESHCIDYETRECCRNSCDSFKQAVGTDGSWVRKEMSHGDIPVRLACTSMHFMDSLQLFQVPA